MFYRVVHGAGLIQLAFGCMMVGLGSQAVSKANEKKECQTPDVMSAVFYFLGALLLFITGMVALTWKKPV